MTHTQLESRDGPTLGMCLMPGHSCFSRANRSVPCAPYHCFPPPTRLEAPWRGECLLFVTACPKCLEPCLARSGCSVHSCPVDERMEGHVVLTLCEWHSMWLSVSQQEGQMRKVRLRVTKRLPESAEPNRLSEDQLSYAVSCVGYCELCPAEELSSMAKDKQDNNNS